MYNINNESCVSISKHCCFNPLLISLSSSGVTISIIELCCTKQILINHLIISAGFSLKQLVIICVIYLINAYLNIMCASMKATKFEYIP